VLALDPADPALRDVPIFIVIDERLAGQAVGAVEVDDDATWLELVAADLRHGRRDVTAVTDPPHALELAHSHAFDLVVTDLAIRGWTGSLWSTRCVPIRRRSTCRYS